MSGRDVERVARGRGRPAAWRRSTWRGSPWNGVPSRLWMSQNTRASVAFGSPHGSTSNVFGSGIGEHVALLDAAEPVDRRAVERHPVLERVLELGRADREALEVAEHVGEPQADEADAALFDACAARSRVVGRARRSLSAVWSVGRVDRKAGRRGPPACRDPRRDRPRRGSSTISAQTLSRISRVTVYGSQLAFGRRSSA